MASGPAALDGSSPASSFKVLASEISIRGISGTLGLNVPGIFSSLREPSANPSSMVFSESWFSFRGETGVKTDCRWLLIMNFIGMGSRRGPIPCESWREFFPERK